MEGTPLVTIRCLVYNHEPYLRQCLDGFVMQQTTFPFEAIVHDDASTDGSAAIIREYAEKYPDIIKPIYETENQFCKGTIDSIMVAATHPDSKYIAMCEGDDYWTHPQKLQIQVAFLESHPDYYMTCHAFKYYFEDAKEFRDPPFLNDLPLEEYEGREYCNPTIKEFFSPIWFTQLLSIVYRKQICMDTEKILKYKTFYDYVSCYYMLKAGKCALFKDVMGVYRKQGQGVYTGRDENIWRRDYLDNYYILYELEREEHVLPIIDTCFVNEFLSDIKNKEISNAVTSLIKHFRIVPLKNSLSCLGGITKAMIHSIKKRSRLL